MLVHVVTVDNHIVNRHSVTLRSLTLAVNPSMHVQLNLQYIAMIMMALSQITHYQTAGISVN